MKTLFLTGGNEGIGYYMTKKWLEDGNCAVVLDLNCDNIGELKETYSRTLICIKGDVRDKEGIEAAVNQTCAQFGSIDYAVHNACLCLFKSFEEHSMEDYITVMGVNFHGAINMTKAVIPFMKKQGHGRIYFTSSGVGVTGFTNISSYSCSKGAVESLAKCMNIEYAESGITFHIMHPPLTNTRSSSPLPVPKEFKASAEKVGKGLIKHIDSKKFIIAPSFSDAISVKLSYLFAIPMGKLLTKMTKKANVSSAK